VQIALKHATVFAVGRDTMTGFPSAFAEIDLPTAISDTFAT
jgi:hypothetical protein